MNKARSQLLSHAFQEAGSAITITIRCKGEEHVTELPFTKDVIDRLVALEADLHHVKIDDVSKLIINTMKKGLLQLMLDS